MLGTADSPCPLLGFRQRDPLVVGSLALALQVDVTFLKGDRFALERLFGLSLLHGEAGIHAGQLFFDPSLAFERIQRLLLLLANDDVGDRQDDNQQHRRNRADYGEPGCQRTSPRPFEPTFHAAHGASVNGFTGHEAAKVGCLLYTSTGV